MTHDEIRKKIDAHRELYPNLSMSWEYLALSQLLEENERLLVQLARAETVPA